MPVTGPLFAWSDAMRAARRRRAALRRRAAITACGIVVVLGSVAWPPAPRLLWNATASAPIGLYHVSPGASAAPGEMVVARVPQGYRRMVAARRYLPANVPLVKRVVAAAGDEICARKGRIFVDGRPAAFRRPVDGRGRAMPGWVGCIRLRGAQLFLLSDNPASFDGRYFGVTEGKDVVGDATLLWHR
ncbi:S26 family signal peptidase [Sphingomonas koreensis]|nr:S26 family signal peptidase [Sphingomonas koreensis]